MAKKVPSLKATKKAAAPVKATLKAKKKETTYNILLKQFTAVNNTLPAEQKISLKQRRKILKQHLLPQFDGLPKYKVKLKDIKAAIQKEYDKLPSRPPESCNLNFIDPSNYKQPIEFFEIDEFFESVIPDCIYVKVTAGEFGETNIFNTRDYSYGRKGVQQITENIRQKSGKSGFAFYIGYQKLRPGKPNDGQGENYYLDMILFVNDIPQGQTTTTKYKLPKTGEVNTAKRKVQRLMDAKFKTLKKEKASVQRAKKELQKQVKKIKDADKKLKKSPSSKTFLAQSQKIKDSFIKRAENAYKKGYITKEKMEQILRDNL